MSDKPDKLGKSDKPNQSDKPFVVKPLTFDSNSYIILTERNIRR